MKTHSIPAKLLRTPRSYDFLYILLYISHKIRPMCINVLETMSLFSAKPIYKIFQALLNPIRMCQTRCVSRCFVFAVVVLLSIFIETLIQLRATPATQSKTM